MTRKIKTAAQPNGRPPYKPNAKDRGVVQSMTAYGISAQEIADVLGIGRTTLFKYYQAELTTAHVSANAKVAETAYQLAISGKCPAATFFWLKTRAGWREVARFEHSGNVGTYDLTKISDADLSNLESILGPLADNRPDPVGAGTPAFVPDTAT